MKIFLRILIHFAVLTALFWSTKPVTWFKAQSVCRERNQTLTLQQNESSSFYWTGFYKRLSYWIKLIGCYNASTIEHETETSIELSLFSPPLCQKYCLQKDIYLFAVQRNTCLCLPASSFNEDQNQLNPSKCTYTCNETTLLSTECGGESAFNVFRTDKTMLKIQTRCISLQCGAAPLFDDLNCTDHLPVICSTSIMDKYMNWTDSLAYCKKNDSYILGNINLSNITSSCTGFNHSNQRWIGVVKEDFLSTDDGEVITESDHHYFYLCMKCKTNDVGNIECKYVQCDESKNSKVFCTESKNVEVPETETTGVFKSTETTDVFKSTETTESNINSFQKESSNVQLVVPVVLVLVILFGCAVAIAIYLRRRKANDAKGGIVPEAKNAGLYSNTELKNDKNYLVHQQSNPTYELADNSKIETESPYNEAEDGTYDHLGHKGARKRPADDIYNHASSGSLSDLSDYNVANRKNSRSEDNANERTGVRDDSYGKLKSDLFDFDVANRKHLNEENSTYDYAEAGDNSYGKFNLSRVKETDFSE